MKKRLLFCVLMAVMLDGHAVADLASVNYVRNITAALNDSVVHNTGDETVSGVKTFSDSIVLENAPQPNSNDNTVPTTAWTNNKIDSAKGQVPVGAANGTTFVSMWMEE